MTFDIKRRSVHGVGLLDMINGICLGASLTLLRFDELYLVGDLDLGGRNFFSGVMATLVRTLLAGTSSLE